MPTNKVQFGSTVLIDLTEDTVDQASLLEGKTAHDKTGNIITGTVKVQKYYVEESGNTIDTSILEEGDFIMRVTEVNT